MFLVGETKKNTRNRLVCIVYVTKIMIERTREEKDIVLVIKLNFILFCTSTHYSVLEGSTQEHGQKDYNG